MYLCREEWRGYIANGTSFPDLIKNMLTYSLNVVYMKYSMEKVVVMTEIICVKCVCMNNLDKSPITTSSLEARNID